jgi:hypothetical protein
VSALLAIQRSAGNVAVCGLLQPSLGQARPAQAQRRILVQAPAAQPVDLTEVLRAHKLDKEGVLRAWFNTQVKPGLLGQFGFQRFMGYLRNQTNEYSFSVTVDKALAAVSFEELSQAVQRGLNTRILSQKIETGHSSLGNVKLLSRSGFPTAIKNSYEKSQVIKELESQVGTSYAPKQIHLRHFVMGSWFRALPAIVEKADLQPPARDDLSKQVAGLIPRVAPLAGVQSASSSGDPQKDVEVLSGLLHDLLPNLNAGAGPENTIIGFVSNGLSNLAEDVRKDNIAIARDDIDELVTAAVDGVTIVSADERRRYKEETDLAGVFTAMVDKYAGDGDPVVPDALALALHDFAFQLGMDFMKHEVGKAQQFQTSPLPKLQEQLYPLGQTLYSLILEAQKGPVDVVNLAKFFNAVESAVGSLEKMLSS